MIAPGVTLAIDPGTRSLGYAFFCRERVLRDCGFLRATGAQEMIAKLPTIYGASPVGDGRIVVELPQIYRASRAKGDPNDVIQLALVVGAVCTFGSTQLVQPRDWKGTAPKEVMHERFLGRLFDHELARVHVHLARTPTTSRADVLDALGLGLWSVGRL